jgi:hypothetical protein
MKNAIIIKLFGGRDMEYKDGAQENFDRFENNLRTNVADRTAVIVFNDGTFDLEEHRKLLATTKGFTTYVLYKFRQPVEITESDEFWHLLDALTLQKNWPELIEKTYTYQLVEMLYYDGNSV